MINYMVDSENVGTKWIPYLKENIKKNRPGIFILHR